MRAVFLRDIELFETIELKGNKFHHLIKVLRVKQNFRILVINGVGQSRLYDIKEVLKKSCIIQSETEINQAKRKNVPDVMICSPKKDYSENMIRSCVELGVNKVLFAQSEFSQWEYVENNRIDQILCSSMEQSNNHYLPLINNCDKLTGFNFSQYKKVVVFSSQTQLCEKLDNHDLKDTLIVIGPEAGFSDSENKFFDKLDNKVLVNIPVNIMKAVTALPVALGYVLGGASQ